ncbi:RING finger domain protein [Aspergillus sclerotialis]|uniref:RING finger domain protein n=1 Tax=Aspergillus sclerotialis TaxID=2070753 RepID=A0A3A2ZLR4_9EURO|nr:RING finger domain protein [Aspergillus sclerotialis]
MGSESDSINRHHIAIALGIGLGIVVVIIICLVLAVLLNRRYSSRPFVSKDKEEKLRKLDAVSPVRTLEEFWSNLKGPITSSEGTDGQFNCAVCLDPVLPSQNIRELKCPHIFHKDCLEKWYLKNHYNCPLCHKPYYVQETQPGTDFVWMV